MAGYEAIADVAESLKRYLQLGMNDVFGETTNAVEVTLDSPKKIEEDGRTESRLLSLYLFKITQNTFLRNQPPAPLNATQLRPRPLVVDLSMMITPYGASEDNRLRILGRAIQLLDVDPILSGTDLQRTLSGSLEQIVITHQPVTQDLISQVWQALELSMRLGAFYLVAPVTLEPDMVNSDEPVIRRAAGDGFLEEAP